MGLFKRNRGPDGAAPEHVDLSTLLLEGEDMIDQLALAHVGWGIGSGDRWDLDQRTGIITWTFPDKRIATAPAQIIEDRCRRRESRDAFRTRRQNHSGNRLLPRHRTFRNSDHHLRCGHPHGSGRHNVDL